MICRKKVGVTELPTKIFAHQVNAKVISSIFCILVPRGRAPFGQHQESRPLAKSNTGSPRFTDFPSLCACSVSSLKSLIGSDLNLLCLQSHSKTECRWTRQRSRFLVLTKRSAASGDENVYFVEFSTRCARLKMTWHARDQ